MRNSSKKKGTDAPELLFRQTLRRFAGAKGWHHPDALARVMNWEGEDRRWLNRIWFDGLKRLDRRREKSLDRLARRVGLRRAADFWRVGQNPFAKETAFTWWSFAVEYVLLWNELLERGRRVGNGEVLRLIDIYGKGCVMRAVTNRVSLAVGIDDNADEQLRRDYVLLSKAIDFDLADAETLTYLSERLNHNGDGVAIRRQLWAAAREAIKEEASEAVKSVPPSPLAVAFAKAMKAAGKDVRDDEAGRPRGDVRLVLRTASERLAPESEEVEVSAYLAQVVRKLRSDVPTKEDVWAMLRRRYTAPADSTSG